MKETWIEIESDYELSKRDFGKKINFVADKFKREVIFRDIAQSVDLANKGFNKPAVILAGGVIEELLRLYLEHKKIKYTGNNFASYIKACESNGFLKEPIHKLTDSVRDFKNVVHLAKEGSKKNTITKATAKAAVASIFMIAQDLNQSTIRN